MNTDFRVSINLLRHKKGRKLRRKLGMAGIGYLVGVWAHYAEFFPKGIAPNNADTIADIEDSAFWEGDQGALVETLGEIGFLDISDDHIAIHDWHDHNAFAASADERSESARKAAQAKWNKHATSMRPACDPHAGRTNPHSDQHATRYAPSPSPSPSPSPFPFPSPAREPQPDPAPQEPAATVTERQPEPPTAEKKEKNGVTDSDFGKTTIADDWEPKASTLAGLAAMGIDADHAKRQVTHFRLHHAEAGTLAKGFEALFVGWCKRAPKPEAKASADPLARRPGETLAEASDRRSQEYWGSVPPDERIDLDGSTIPVRKCYDKYLTH